MLTHEQAAAQKCGEALQESRREYDDLLEKYDELRKECDSLKAAICGGGTFSAPYVMVLIDSHSQKVCIRSSQSGLY